MYGCVCGWVYRSVGVYCGCVSVDVMCLDVCGVYVSVCRCTGVLPAAGCYEKVDILHESEYADVYRARVHSYWVYL